MSSREAFRRVASASASAANHSSRQQQRWISSTPIRLEKKTVMVPTMGDSITEGTIVEWAVQVGQAVKADDVVALVETDKVTIDIKAEIDGVLTQQFGAVDETVEVGAKLYEIDTEGEATFTSDTASPPAQDKTEQQQEISATATTTSEPLPSTSTSSSAKKDAESSSAAAASRAPSINFLGKEGWATRRSGQQEQATAAASSAPSKPHAVTVIQDDAVRHPMYGRPPFSEEEVEALMWGGANLVAGWKIKN